MNSSFIKLHLSGLSSQQPEKYIMLTTDARNWDCCAKPDCEGLQSLEIACQFYRTMSYKTSCAILVRA